MEQLQRDQTEEYCIQRGVLIATALYYRVSLSVSCIASILSVFGMICFLYRQYRSSLFFHNNLRVLFLSLCICCLAYDSWNIGMKVHHLALSFLYTAPCQIFLPKYLYMTMNITFSFIWLTPQFILVSIVTERWFAVVYIRSYELRYKKLGPGLLVLAVLISISTLVFLYYGETFDEPQINGRVLTSTRYFSGNIVIIMMLIVNFIGCAFTIALRFFKPRRLIRMPLSLKFQSKENAITSNLLFWIATLQFMAVFLSQIGALYVRIYHSTHKLAIAFKENMDVFNYYTLALPVISTAYLLKVKRRRIKDIKDNVNIKTIGKDGWINYSSVIQEQWK
uniref:G_PROTEIN_RECEP_F1_2 domain-containing protein n=1 Tax=Haemonchus contortus TaxID=6289 RepID=A0A7I5EBI0_HAECO